ncbi:MULTISPECIES: prenyltransferase/squalene oxidase repeat-containing protein [Rhodanobacter]|uniref:Prenyltransferase alpha-alpha toroid domain-containing protein n=1 Tax=Rhodanobacter thiooxydans TaxID=416169 RepID=A0A154QEG3_9GAMM|nr:MULTISPECIES: prenyltransferase/squalene oxidase repeat-containing protein [Rhodanobacter]KZC22681.1 hypothetical protein RHOFW104T7_17900 [Rhodanobacter thiooxydans]UJJ52759.1 hypothetical protein LRK52_08810 [Rhodanobacter denitrificans]UJM95530.1 hypothetical protein LRK32_08935 [Rhodanobacter denitrificans]UJM99061.1 hypothetical protein LRK44_08940 [Rhodanobacter denitrificans]UJN21524.1 hypothetical protein LRK54_17700 [Rhodanobacter denitrificans]
MSSDSAISIDSRKNPLVSALDRVRTYLLERQSPNGGFCFYRGYYVEEPNLSDTWHAIVVLTELLGVVLPEKSSHASFIIGQPVEPQPLALYYRVRALLALEVGDPESAEVASAVMALQTHFPDIATYASLSAALQRIKCTVWLKRRFGLPMAVDDLARTLLQGEHDDGGYGTPANLLDTEAAIAVLMLCGHAASSRTGDFVNRMAVPGFGFRLTAGSLSPNLETVCAGMRSCCRLGLSVPHAQDAVAFMLSCQTGNGGFARAAGALPDITLTYLALTTLARQMAPRLLRDMVPPRSDA